MNLLLQISSKCGQWGRGLKNPKVLWMSYLEAPLIRLLNDWHFPECMGGPWNVGVCVYVVQNSAEDPVGHRKVMKKCEREECVWPWRVWHLMRQEQTGGMGRACEYVRPPNNLVQFHAKYLQRTFGRLMRSAYHKYSAGRGRGFVRRKLNNYVGKWTLN